MTPVTWSAQTGASAQKSPRLSRNFNKPVLTKEGAAALWHKKPTLAIKALSAKAGAAAALWHKKQTLAIKALSTKAGAAALWHKKQTLAIQALLTKVGAAAALWHKKQTPAIKVRTKALLLRPLPSGGAGVTAAPATT